jgi:hypothetical protein
VLQLAGAGLRAGENHHEDSKYARKKVVIKKRKILRRIWLVCRFVAINSRYRRFRREFPFLAALS